MPKVLALIMLTLAVWGSACRPSLAVSPFEAPDTNLAVSSAEGPAIPDDRTLEANGAVIGEITLRVNDIFDLTNPKENNALYRVANKLHIATRESVVRSYLLFKSGEPYSRRLLDETERSLRNTQFLYDAFIVPVRYHDNIVDLEVITRDVWTLTGGINYSLKGGETSTGFEIEDSNFLGYGHSFSLSHSVDEDRTSDLFRYDAPNVGGQHTNIIVTLGSNSDGDLYGLNYAKPFFSLDTSKSYGFNIEGEDYDESRFENGIAVADYHRTDRLFEVFLGHSDGLVNNRTIQWTLGYTHAERLYSPNDETGDPAEVPENDAESFPWISMRYIEDYFIKTQRLSFFGRTEDLNLGNEFLIKIGWSDHAISSGAPSDEVIYELSYSRGLLLKKERYLLLNFDSEGRIASEHSENVLNSGRIRYYNPHDSRQVFYTSLFMQNAHDLDDPNVIQLGGDTGMRGYPAHIQDGDRMFLLTVEQRFYHERHFFEFFYAGGALFFDMGRAWDPDVGPGPNSGVLKDVGAGLRLTSSRAGKGKVLHIDAAYPLDGDDVDRTIQINISMESEF